MQRLVSKYIDLILCSQLIILCALVAVTSGKSYPKRGAKASSLRHETLDKGVEVHKVAGKVGYTGERASKLTLGTRTSGFAVNQRGHQTYPLSFNNRHYNQFYNGPYNQYFNDFGIPYSSSTYYGQPYSPVSSFPFFQPTSFGAYGPFDIYGQNVRGPYSYGHFNSFSFDPLFNFNNQLTYGQGLHDFFPYGYL